MISKFFSKSGSGKNAIDYLLKKEKSAVLLKGNPNNFIDLVDSLKFKNTYTSGVLRFNETLTAEQREEIINQYSEFLTAGLNQPPEVIWVLHQEHGEDELHFVVPNIDLESRRLFQPYQHKVDLKCRDALDNKINSQFNFSDPDDPKNQRATNSASNYLKTTKNRAELGKAIDDFIAEKALLAVKNGLVFTQSLAIEELENLGFEVKLNRSKQIVIHHEDLGKKGLKLKGDLYDKNCRFDRKSESEIEKRSGQYRENRDSRFNTSNEEYSILIEKRTGFIREKYKRSWERVAEESKKLEQDVLCNTTSNADSSSNSNINNLPALEIHSKKSRETLHDSKSNRQLQQCKRVENTQARKQDFSNNPESDDFELQLQQSQSVSNNKRIIDCYFKNTEKYLGSIEVTKNKLTAIDFKTDKAAAFNIVKNAKIKGWTDIEFSGNDEFVKNAMTYAIQNKLEVIPKNAKQQKILNEVIEDDRTRKNAYRTCRKSKQIVEKLGNGDENHTRRKHDFAEKIREFDSTSEQLDRAINEKRLEMEEQKRTRIAEDLKQKLEKKDTSKTDIEEAENENSFEM